MFIIFFVDNKVLWVFTIEGEADKEAFWFLRPFYWVAHVASKNMNQTRSASVSESRSQVQRVFGDQLYRAALTQSLQSFKTPHSP